MRRKKKLSTAASRELKAEYFEKCGEIVRMIGTEEWDSAHDDFFKEIQEITNRMCEAGMREIAKQEFDNIRELCRDLGYYIETDKNEKDV